MSADIPSMGKRGFASDNYAGIHPKVLEAIADANGANQLRNPIDNSVIHTDVFGNPRTYLGTRDIGAVQSPPEVPGPLPALGLAAAFRWSRRLRRTVRSARR